MRLLFAAVGAGVGFVLVASTLIVPIALWSPGRMNYAPVRLLSAIGADPMSSSGLRESIVTDTLGLLTLAVFFVVLVCVVLMRYSGPWLLRVLTITGTVLLLMLIGWHIVQLSAMLVMWDGVDVNGRPTGGMEVGAPGPGLFLLIAAVPSSIVALVGSFLPRPKQRLNYSAKNSFHAPSSRRA